MANLGISQMQDIISIINNLNCHIYGALTKCICTRGVEEKEEKEEEEEEE